MHLFSKDVKITTAIIRSWKSTFGNFTRLNVTIPDLFVFFFIVIILVNYSAVMPNRAKFGINVK